jgi:ribosomal protein L7/L12
MDRELMDEIQKLRGQVFELSNRLEFLYKKLNIEYVEENTGADPRLIVAIKKGNMIDAIKVYRELTNASFQDAKTAVEGMWGKYSG